MRGLLNQARSLPAGVVVRKGLARVTKWMSSQVQSRACAKRGTYSTEVHLLSPLSLASVIPNGEEAEAMMAVARLASGHRIDLLGSGWVHLKRDQPNPVPPGCRAESDRIFQLASPDYEPIDWHSDFKSGFRWRANSWHSTIAYGHVPGVDVKVPWELSRLQHLPVLALAARATPHAEEAVVWRTEAVDQMLDWIASNPPLFGVNWRTAMDVGIRAANLALAADLLVEDGWRGEWEGVLARSLHEHARHIAAHLEWSPSFRGNHYLANVAGLAWCAAHLAESEQTNAWLAWSAQELQIEVGRQFLPDGANFEASVCYHRLGAEMVAWTCACLASVPAERWDRIRSVPGRLAPARPALTQGGEPDWEHLRRSLGGMATFMRWMTKHDGRVAQFGDNDSGRFFRLPGYVLGPDRVPREVSLDHSETFGVLETLCGGEAATVSSKLASGLAPWGRPVRAPNPPPTHGGRPPRVVGESWSLGDDAWAGLETAAFPDFGVYVWRSKRVWMAVRCGGVGQNGLGGHAHCDALTLELQVDGTDWIADPGTGVYTSDPATRNRYRSAAAHFCPRVEGREPSSLNQGVFRLKEYGAKCVAFGPEGFEGSHTGFGGGVSRRLELHPTGFVLQDAWQGGELVSLGQPDAFHPWRAVPFSPGYGSFEE